MATRYWVGGSGNWSDATNHWSNASGGSPSASYLPTSADSVVFDANSNVGTSAFTVTVDAASACLNFTASGLDGAMTVESSVTNVALDVYGSMSLPATNMNWSPASGITLTFRGTSSYTITANGNTLNTTSLTLDAVGGTLTLGSALTLNSTRSLTITNGTFSTSASNYALSCGAISSSNSNVRTISLNASAVTLTGTTVINFTTSTNLTFNAGTSTITPNATSPVINGGGVTFYNVTFSSAANGTATINGTNTFNNLTFTTRSATGVRQIIFSNSQTVSNTLTFGTTNTAIRRMSVYGTTNTGTGVGTAVTLTVATIATLSDVDFRDITAAGASGTWTGTRLGNGGGNSNITFAAGVTKYWNLAAGGNWSATAWATASGGAVNVNNFPLAQDSVIIENTGLNTGATITTDTNWWLPTIDASSRTNAFTLAGSAALIMNGSLTLPSVATVTNSSNWYFGANNSTQNVTTNGVSITFAINCNGTTTNTVKLIDSLASTNTVTLQQGTLDLNNNTLTCTTFSSSNSITRTIAFGTGNITLTGNAAGIFTLTTITNLTVTGTPVVNATYSGSTGNRSFSIGALGESQAISVNVTAGSDTVSLATSGGSFKNVSFSGFSGIINFSNSVNVYGNWDVGGATSITGSGNISFAATSGTKTVRSGNLTWPNNVTFNGIGGTWACQDALSVTGTLTITNGTLQLKAGATSTVGMFATSGTNQKYLQSTTPGTQATISDASGTISVSYLTIKDSNATGGATWQAYTTNSNVNDGNNTGWTFYFNIYNSTISESVTSTDVPETNVINYVSVSESMNILDALLSRYLWTTINNGQTANWQNITNTTSVWTDVNNT